MKRVSFPGVVATIVIAVLYCASASPFGVLTNLTFSSPMNMLSGYSATFTTGGEDEEAGYCTYWVWYVVYNYGSPEYITMCGTYEGYFTTSVEVQGELVGPSGLVNTGSQYGTTLAQMSHFVVQPEPGQWYATGSHGATKTTFFCNTWFFYDGVNYWAVPECYPTSSAPFYIGTTGAEAMAAACNPVVSQIIAEYATHNVNLTPVCTDFANAGGSAHFSWAELTSGTGNPHAPWGRIRPVVLPGLESIRANYNRGAITISSGYRCPHGNAAVGGAAQSRHMWGDAVDMVSTDQAWNQAEWTLLSAAATAGGATWIEPYEDDPSHVHADWR